MVRSILALASGFVFWGQCLAQQSLVGTYKLVSTDLRLDGIPVTPMGKSPSATQPGKMFTSRAEYERID